MYVFVYAILFILASGCNDQANLLVAAGGTSRVDSGDIIVVSGGSVNRTVSPFPIHSIAQFSRIGEFKRFLYESPTLTEYLWGADLDPITGDLVYGLENIDRLQRIDLESRQVLPDILDPNLSGNTIRAVTVLSDGSRIVAESPTVLEKFSPSGVRATAPFPITIPSAINSLKRISGNRFAVSFTGNPDMTRIYNNSGTLAGTFASATGFCTNNCDPYEVEELPDGRFLVTSRIANNGSILLYNANFSFVTRAYQDLNVLRTPSSIATLKNGNYIICCTTYNTCEEFSLSGNSLNRVGIQSLIANPSLVRQPTKVLVVP
jgi:hypothetical protein